MIAAYALTISVKLDNKDVMNFVLNFLATLVRRMWKKVLMFIAAAKCS